MEQRAMLREALLQVKNLLWWDEYAQKDLNKSRVDNPALGDSVFASRASGCHLDTQTLRKPTLGHPIFCL